MNEIYWLTRLDALCNIFGWCIGIGTIVTLVCIICYILNESESYSDNYKQWKSFFKRKFNWSIPLLVVGALGLTFTPNTKEAFLIYGIGGSIDYLKENPTAKQLPDKMINILDEWVDELSPNKNNKND